MRTGSSSSTEDSSSANQTQVESISLLVYIVNRTYCSQSQIWGWLLVEYCDNFRRMGKTDDVHSATPPLVIGYNLLLPMEPEKFSSVASFS
jgi:hypothetical protein